MRSIIVGVVVIVAAVILGGAQWWNPAQPDLPTSDFAQVPFPARAAITWRPETFGAPGATVIHSGSEAIAFLERIQRNKWSKCSPGFASDTIAVLPARDGGVVLAIADGTHWQLAFADGNGGITFSDEVLQDTAARDRWVTDHTTEIAAAWDPRHQEALVWAQRIYRSSKSVSFMGVGDAAVALRAERGEQGWEITGTTSRSENGASGWQTTLADDGSVLQSGMRWSACGGRRHSCGRDPKFPTGIN